MRSAFENQPSVMGARVVVTTMVIAAGVAIFGLQGKSFEAFAIGPEAWPEKPWLFLTTNFLHIGSLHILFNLYWMWGLGAQVEEQYGSLRTLGFFLLFAMAPSAAEWGLFGAGVGLSGVVYGWFGMRWALSRFHPDHRAACPERLIELFVGWFFICIALTYFDILGIANVAHGVGGLMGFVTGWALSPARENAPRLLQRFSNSGRWAIAALVFGLCLFAGTVGRRWVNLSPRSRVAIYFQDGIEAYEGKDHEAAAESFSHVIRLNDGCAGAWFNLGLAREALAVR